MKQVARWAVLLPLFIIPFLPLYVANGMFFPFITGKNFAFRMLVEIALAGSVYLALVDRAYRPRFSWTMALYGALVAWMAVADFLAVNPHKAFWSNYERMDGWVTLAHVFALFAIMGTFLAVEKRWRQWWMWFLGASALVSAYGIFQMLGVLATHQSMTRVDATLGNPEYFAAYMLFVIAAAIWQGIESKGWLKNALFVLAAVDVVLLFESQTRAAAVAIAGAAVVGAGLWMLESGKETRRIAAGLLIALVVIVGGFVAMRNSAFVQGNETLSRIADISPAALSTRLTIWEMALKGFEARPVAGWGQEGFNYVFNTYYQPSMYAQESWFDRAHNTFLDWLIAGGLPAFLLFGALFVSAALALYRRSVSRAERILLLSALAAYLIQSLTVFDNLFSYVPLATVFAMAHVASSRPIKRLEDAPVVRGDMENVAAPIVAVVLALVLWFVNVPSYRASAHLIDALRNGTDPAAGLAGFKAALADGGFGSQEIREQLVTFSTSVDGSSADTATKTAVAAYAIDQMKQEIAHSPNDARLWLELAIGYRAAGDLTDARAASAQAHELSPQKQGIIFEQGAEAASAGDFESVQALFHSAYDLDPSYADAAAYAAAGDIFAGDTEAGKALLLSHFGTTTVDNSILIGAYYQQKDFKSIVDILRLRAAESGSADDAFNVARAQVAGGDLAGAEATIKAAVAEHPEAAEEADALLSQLGAMR